MSLYTPVLLLLLVSITTASHFWGGTISFTPKGRNPDGSYRVDFRYKHTFDSCYQDHLTWSYCRHGHCGSQTSLELGKIDDSNGRYSYSRNWCLKEGVMTRRLWSDKPFELTGRSCCWVSLNNYLSWWDLPIKVDLGVRSDTNEPNHSPRATTISFVSVPQNCPRTYNFVGCDPDGDKFRCRSLRSLPSGFSLNRDTCTLSYTGTGSTGYYGFEIVVEDHPKQHINVTYSDGTTFFRGPVHARRRRRSPWGSILAGRKRRSSVHAGRQKRSAWGGWSSTVAPPSTTPFITSQYNTAPWLGTFAPTTTTTTTGGPTTPSWGWWGYQSTTAPSATPWWWWFHHQTQALTVPPTTTAGPVTAQASTSSPTTPSWWWWHPQTPSTTVPPLTTSSSTTTQPSTSSPTTPWWWWWNHHAQSPTMTPPTTSSSTTTQASTSGPTTPWWWWWNHHAQSTTVPPPTTSSSTTTQASTSGPTTPWWWWWNHHAQSTTVPPPTTSSSTTTQASTSSPTTPWWWWWNQHTQSTTMVPTTMTSPTTTQASTNGPTTPWWWWWQTQTPTTTPVTTSNPWLHYGTPLSQIPLQFVVFVDSAAPSCSEGLYLPKFQHPTPHNQEHLHVGINQELEIRINATASYSVVQNLIISGPLNITKDRIISGEFVLRWTPRTDDLNQHFPICFIAESKWGSRYFQSEMRCVIVEVEEHQRAPQANVICTDNFMAIELETSISENIRLHVDHLRLNDPSCTLYSNGSHVFANMSLNTCGTKVEEDENYLFFKNEISTFDNPNDIITRINQVEFQFFCKYPKKNSVTLEFDTHRGPYVFTQKGFGTFSYQFEFFQSSHFQYRKDPNSYPLEYGLGQMMYMQIEGISSVNNTELFLESCRASPTDNPQSQTFYTIIENGCNKDETVQFYSNRDSKVQFGMKAFKFIGWHDQVFITCSVILCEAGNPNTRCSQGCTNATATPSVHHHHRREAPIQTTSHHISQGPVRLSRSADIQDSSSTAVNNGLNMNLVFIAGCVLIVVAMVCGALIYRRRPKIAYQPLPTAEF